MELYDLDFAYELIKKRFKKNPRSSLSAMFRDLRKRNYFEYFGDYPLLSAITESLRELNIPVKKSNLRYAISKNKIEELKRSQILFDQLLKGTPVTLKENCNALGNTKTQGMGKDVVSDHSKFKCA